MRFPWQSAEDDRVQDGDAQEDLLDLEGDTEGDGEEEIPPETQALIEKARQEERQRVTEAAAKRGLAWTGDDFGVTDYGRAQASFGFHQQQQQPVQLQQPAEDADDEPEFDPYDADAVRAHNAWQIRQATKETNAQLQATQQMLAEERMSRAIDRVEDAVKKHAPHLEAWLDHPDFAEAFPLALQTQDAKIWSNPRLLASLVATLSVELDREKLPKKDARERDEGGRFTMGEQQRRQLGQISGSRDAGRVPPDEQDEESVRIASRYLGVPASQVRAARHTSIDAWRAERAAAKGKERGR